MDETKQLVDGKVRFDINSNTISDISFRNTDLNFDTTQLSEILIFIARIQFNCNR